MALGIGEHGDRGTAGNVHRWLERPAPQLLNPGQCRGGILHLDIERHVARLALGSLGEREPQAADRIRLDRDRGSVGVASPGAISKRTGVIKNSNSTGLNGNPLDQLMMGLISHPPTTSSTHPGDFDK